MIANTRAEIAERITAEEFFRDAPEERKAELIDGVMVMPSPALVTHERLQRFLLTLLTLFVEEHNLGEVLGSRTAVALDRLNAPEPDILFVARARANMIREKGVFGAPDLVIEILSAGTARNDRGPKFAAYERAGVRELWLIDPYGPAGTEFYHWTNGRFQRVDADAGGILRSAAVAGFWLDVRWLWPDGAFVPVSRALARIDGEPNPG